MAKWHEAERRLQTAERGSPEAVTLLAGMAHLRYAYDVEVAMARRANRPPPPPFPSETGHAGPGDPPDRP